METPHVHDALVERLVADSAPVRRLWPVRLRLTLWAGCGVMIGAIVLTTGARADLADRLREPLFALQVALLFVASALTAALALRAAVPGREPHRVETLLDATILVAILAVAMLLPSQPYDSFTSFATHGIGCARSTLLVAAVPWIGLLVAIARGAPLGIGTAGGLAGGAALLFAAGVVRLACPLEERLHVLAWHLAPIVIGVPLSAALGRLLLDRWRARW